ncbi:MAG: DUF2334 domain-containing protein [Gammaproteobacteria bacterium]|nr:DUF2334 domain-containing protein [Gammaproteobacteria bacterium]
MKAHFSVHDVMPSTWSAVNETIDFLQSENVKQITLLVVPGLDWQPNHLAQFQQWQRDGFELAGHGWRHKVEKTQGVYAWLHSKLFSRDVAEHLSLSSEQVGELIDQCYRWFGQHDLQAPNLYVPPAWAMGSIKRHQLDQLPFRYYETMNGWYDNQRQRFIASPMLGFEADKWFRVPPVKLWNWFSKRSAQRRQHCRLAIHPHDLNLRLHSELRAAIKHWGSTACATAAI